MNRIDIIITTEDIDALSRLAQAEARVIVQRNYETPEVAYGSVVDTVLNRVATPRRFGENVIDVIQQPGGFEPLSISDPQHDWTALPEADSEVYQAVVDYLASRLQGGSNILGSANMFSNQTITEENWESTLVPGTEIVIGQGVDIHRFGVTYDRDGILRSIPFFYSITVEFSTGADVPAALLDFSGQTFFFLANGTPITEVESDYLSQNFDAAGSNGLGAHEIIDVTIENGVATIETANRGKWIAEGWDDDGNGIVDNRDKDWGYGDAPPLRPEGLGIGGGAGQIGGINQGNSTNDGTSLAPIVAVQPQIRPDDLNTGSSNSSSNVDDDDRIVTFNGGTYDPNKVVTTDGGTKPWFEDLNPILLDLDGNGVQLTDLARSTVFMEGDEGLKHRTAWAGAGDGVLFYDTDGDNAISDIREDVFTEWGPTATDDLAALRSRFDTNGDGKMTGAELAGFKIKNFMVAALFSLTSACAVSESEPDNLRPVDAIDAVAQSIAFDCNADTGSYELLMRSNLYALWMGAEVFGGRSFLVTSNTLKCPLRVNALADSVTRPALGFSVQPSIAEVFPFVVPRTQEEAQLMTQFQNVNETLRNPRYQTCYINDEDSLRIQTPEAKLIYFQNSTLSLFFFPINFKSSNPVIADIVCGQVFYNQERIN